MDEEKNLPEEKSEKKDLRKARSTNGTLGFRMAAILVVLYMLYQVVRDFLKGGPDAPSVGLLILSIVVLGGGSIVMGIVSYRAWKRETEEKKETNENAEEAREEESDA